MSFLLASPWGLLALVSLPAIVILHRYVVNARRRPVSSLSLWPVSQRTSVEGKTRHRLPWTLPLLLELAAAAILSLLIASLYTSQPPAEQRYIAVLVDGSVSMSGGDAMAQVREHVAEVAGGARVSLFVSGAHARQVGSPYATTDETLEALIELQPAAPVHDLHTSVTLVRQAGFRPEQMLIFTDDPTFEHHRRVVVGAPVDNTAVVAAGWDREAWFVVRHYDALPADEISITADFQLDDQAPTPVELALASNAPERVRFAVPAGVRRVTLRLPDDALRADNEVVLLRPRDEVVRVRVRHPSRRLRRAVRRAVAAVPRMKMSGPGAELVIADGPTDAPFTWILRPAKRGPVASSLSIVAAPDDALLEGIDPRGLVWVGSGTPAQGSPVLLRAGSAALAWREPGRLVMHIDPDGAPPRRLPLAWLDATHLTASFTLDRSGAYHGAIEGLGDGVVLIPPVVLPYAPELAPAVAAGRGEDVLRRLAEATSGITLEHVGQLDHALEATAPAGAPMVHWLALLILALLLTEIAARRGLIQLPRPRWAMPIKGLPAGWKRSSARATAPVAPEVPGSVAPAAPVSEAEPAPSSVFARAKARAGDLRRVGAPYAGPSGDR